MDIIGLRAEGRGETLGPEDSGEILESWKEIAGYLGVTVRTAQNWEHDRGLPIRRDGHGRRARVSADLRELDAWKSGRTIRQNGVPGRTHRRTLILVACLLPLVALALYVTLETIDRSAPLLPAATRFVGNTLEVRDAYGELLWLKQFPESYIPPRGASRVGDVDGDGRSEVLVRIGDNPSFGITNQLLCFNPDGSPRWVKDFKETLHQGGRSFSGFGVKWFDFVTSSAHTYLVVSFANAFYPTVTLLLEPSSGREASRYYHPGHFEVHVTYDLDGDGRNELLLGGVNNPNEGFGFPALAALEVPFPAPDPEKPNFFGFPGGQETAYLLFPRCDADAGQPRLQQVGTLSRAGPDQIMVGFSPVPSYYVVLTSDFEVVDVRPRNELFPLHAHLFRSGVLDHALSHREIEAFGRTVHRFPTAPDGNSVEVTALMRVTWDSEN